MRAALRRVRFVLATIWNKVRPWPADVWALVVIAVLWSVSPILRVRVAPFWADRMGHFIGESDLALRLHALESQAGRRRGVDAFIMPAVACNAQVREMYLRVFRAVPGVRVLDASTSILGRALVGPATRVSLEVMGRQRLSRIYCGSPFVGGLEYCGLRPSGRPFLAFTEREIGEGWERLAPLGIDPTSRYVCLHIRDSAYLQNALPGRDWSYHDYRNPDPHSYAFAIGKLIERGFTVVRMGKVVSGPLPVTHERLIDYAAWEGRSDFLDTFLYAQADFAWSGSASGIEQLATAFGTPLVITDLIPFSDPRMAVDDCTIIPCLLRDASSGELIPLSEMMKHRFGSAALYAQAGIAIVRNTPDEIWQTLEESIARRDGTWPETSKRLQAQADLWRWADECGLAPNLPRGPWDEDFHRARIGARFLDVHADVLMR